MLPLPFPIFVVYTKMEDAGIKKLAFSISFYGRKWEWFANSVYILSN